MLRPLTDLGSTSPLSPPPYYYGTGHPSQAAGTVSSPRKNLKKPKRPLTAYHIYFQIEREFIIQTLSGEDADKSIFEGKKCLSDVPKRYINTKLSPDWYLGPGKRAKRKHRKQHGKIGFLELSRVITSRWTKLGETDPDIKEFVSMIAKRENEEYKRELKEYRENLTKNMILPAVVSKSSSSMKQQSTPQVHQPVPQHHMKEYPQTPPRASSFPFYGPNQPSGDRHFPKSPVQHHQEVGHHQHEFEYSYQQKTPMWGRPQPKDDFDYCISLIDNNTKKSPEPEQHPCKRDSIAASPSFLDPLMFLNHMSDNDCSFDAPATKNLLDDDSDTLDFVDICDDDILSMWKSTSCD